jgi:hypothetical protein
MSHSTHRGAREGLQLPWECLKRFPSKQPSTAVSASTTVSEMTFPENMDFLGLTPELLCPDECKVGRTIATEFEECTKLIVFIPGNLRLLPVCLSMKALHLPPLPLPLPPLLLPLLLLPLLPLAITKRRLLLPLYVLHPKLWHSLNKKQPQPVTRLGILIFLIVLFL